MHYSWKLKNDVSRQNDASVVLCFNDNGVDTKGRSHTAIPESS